MKFLSIELGDALHLMCYCFFLKKWPGLAVNNLRTLIINFDWSVYITFFEKSALSTKVVPQGPFGRIKLYFELKKRPAGAVWADKIVFWARKASRKELLCAPRKNGSRKLWFSSYVHEICDSEESPKFENSI